MVILASGQESGSAAGQSKSSDVSAGVMTGSSVPCGRYCVVGAIVPLRCVCMRAAAYTSWMTKPYSLTKALRYLHTRTAARLVPGALVCGKLAGIVKVGCTCLHRVRTIHRHSHHSRVPAAGDISYFPP